MHFVGKMAIFDPPAFVIEIADPPIWEAILIELEFGIR